MQDNRSLRYTHTATTTMDSSPTHPLEAASAAMTHSLMPRDETATTGPDPDPGRVQEENSADLLDKSDYGSEAFADNPGKSLCVHALSSDSDEDMGGPEKENLNASAAEAGEPSAASTPLREEMNRFRIVDIEPNYTALSGIRKIGDTGTAADADVSMDTPSEANSASGEAFPPRTGPVPVFKRRTVMAMLIPPTVPSLAAMLIPPPVVSTTARQIPLQRAMPIPPLMRQFRCA